jgi:hypothetical membrane protein
MKRNKKMNFGWMTMQYEIVEAESFVDREIEEKTSSRRWDSLNRKLWRKYACVLAMVGSVQALIIIPITMFLYPSGTTYNPSTSGFSFQGNYLTDLGRFISYSGMPNFLSSLLFNISLLLLGVFLIPYFVVLPNFFRGQRQAKWFGKAGSIFGVVMTVGFIGGSLTPSDVFGPAHLMFGTIAFLSGLPMVILYSFAIIETSYYPNRYTIPFIALGIGFFGFLLLLLQGSYLGDVSSLYATGQNIIIFPKLLCFFFQAYCTWKLVDAIHLKKGKSSPG